MNEVDVIRATRADLSDPRRWNKGSIRGRNGSMCLVAAVTHAAYIDFRYNDRLFDRAIEMLTDHLPRADQGLVEFNDHPDTTHGDILNLLDKTLADLGAL